MQLFTTKVQHTGYEIGEFTDIQERSAEETLQLIKELRIGEETVSTDALTDTSVTVENENREFLKVMLLTENSFSFYFYSFKRPVLKTHGMTFEEMKEILMAFFGGHLLTDAFTQTTLNSFSEKIFITNKFEYQLDNRKILIHSVGHLIIVLFPLAVSYFITRSDTDNSSFVSVLVFISILAGFKLLFILSRYLKYKDRYFQISKNENRFQYGVKGNVREYYKTDIETIKIHCPEDTKMSKVTYAMFYIFFKNDEKIEL